MTWTDIILDIIGFAITYLLVAFPLLVWLFPAQYPFTWASALSNTAMGTGVYCIAIGIARYYRSR